jgi:hypothetical protein
MRLWKPFFLLIFLPGILSSAEAFGLVIHLEGEVFVTRGILEFDAQVEEVLMWEDEIETGEDGSLQITFDSSFLSIGPNTLVSFEKEIQDDGTEIFRMNLEEGRFRSKILNLGSRQFFEVVTEEGRLKVHGTDFVTEFSPDEKAGLQVSVIQGVVGMDAAPGDDGSGSQEVGATEGPVTTAIPETLVVQNQRGGVGGEVGGQVESLSFDQMDDLKEDLPLPGDTDTALGIDDLGLDRVSLDAFVDDIRESENEVGEESVSIEDDVESEVESEIELRIELDIEAPKVGIGVPGLGTP